MPPCGGRDRGNWDRGGERGERKDERALPAVSLCRDPPRSALVDPLLDAVDEGVDYMGLHLAAELAAGLDRGPDVLPFHHRSQSRPLEGQRLDMIWLRFS
jgi:hypothetical protein